MIIRGCSDIPKISNFELMALILLNVKANWSPLFEAINSFNSSTINNQYSQVMKSQSH